MIKEDQPKKTQASIVYDRIRRDILTGQLKPDEPLRVGKLQARYETSGSPVREALNRLAASGMVCSHDNRGFFVPSISRTELTDLYKTRTWIEEVALRESIKNGGVSWEEGIVLSHHRLSRAPRKLSGSNNSNPEWEEAHRAFHLALVNACESRFLMHFCHQLHDQSDRYRQFALTVAPDRDSDQEHVGLMQATIDRDAPKAIALLHEHYEQTQHIILQTGLE